MSENQCIAARHCPDPPMPGIKCCERHRDLRRKASAEYQARHRKKNLCVECSNPPEPGASRCRKCLLARRVATRERRGAGEWMSGGRGRPPLFRDEEANA